MLQLNRILERTMAIDGVIAAAIANWDSGSCLMTAGDGTRLDIEAVATSHSQMVKAMMMTSCAPECVRNPIHEVLITFEDQVHLLRPLRHSEHLFLFLAVGKGAGILGVARHRLQTLDSGQAP